MDDVKVAQDAALANVMSAVESALASAPAKRKQDAAVPPAKRQKVPRHMTDLDGHLSSDSDEAPDQGADAEAAAAHLRAALPGSSALGSQRETAAHAGKASGSGSSGSEQEALEHSLRTVHAAQVCLLGSASIFS